MVEMLRVDIGDNRDGAIEAQKAAIALVGLDHHPVAGAKAGVAAIGIDDAAVDHRGIDAARIQQRGNHAGGGGFAMRSGHRHGAFQPHQLGQHFGAAHHGDAGLQRGGHLGVVTLYRRAGNHHRRIAKVLGLVPDEHGDAARAQAFHHIALGDVGALHPVTQIGHHLGDTGHADAANAHEMDRADIGANTLHQYVSVSGVAMVS